MNIHVTLLVQKNPPQRLFMPTSGRHAILGNNHQKVHRMIYAASLKGRNRCRPAGEGPESLEWEGAAK